MILKKDQNILLCHHAAINCISVRLNENIYIVRSRWTLVFHLRTHDLLHGQHTKRMLKGRKEMYVVSFRDVVPYPIA